MRNLSCLPQKGEVGAMLVERSDRLVRGRSAGGFDCRCSLRLSALLRQAGSGTGAELAQGRRIQP